MRPDARRLADLVVALLVLTTVAFSSEMEWLAAAPQAPAGAAPTESASASRLPAGPVGVRAAATSSTQVLVTWTASGAQTGVADYEVYRDGKLLSTVGAVTSFLDLTVKAGSSYSYAVRARDAGRNWSAFSDAALVSTSPGTLPGKIFADDSELGSFADWTMKGSAGKWTFESRRVHGGKVAAQASTTACEALRQEGTPGDLREWLLPRLRIRGVVKRPGEPDALSIRSR